MPLQKEVLLDIVKKYSKNDSFRYIGRIVRGLIEVRSGRKEIINWKRIGDIKHKLEKQVLSQAYKEANSKLKKLSKKQRLTLDEKMLIESLSLLYDFSDNDSDLLMCMFKDCNIKEKDNK